MGRGKAENAVSRAEELVHKIEKCLDNEEQHSVGFGVVGGCCFKYTASKGFIILDDIV